MTVLLRDQKITMTIEYVLINRGTGTCIQSKKTLQSSGYEVHHVFFILLTLRTHVIHIILHVIQAVRLMNVL